MRRVITLFRRSLFLKVFSLTAAISIALIYLVGSNLYGRITGGILDEKIASAISEGRAAIQYAEYRFTIAGLNPKADYRELTEEVVKSANVSVQESGREVVLLNARGVKSEAIPAVNTSNFLEPESVPETLREKIRESADLNWQRGELRYVNGKVIPGIFVGRTLEIPRPGSMRCMLLMTFWRNNEISI